MSTSQVLDRAFHLYRNNFWVFAGIAALPPAVYLAAQASALLTPLIPVLRMDAVASGIFLGVGFVAVAVLYLLALSLATGATVYAVSRVHLGHAVRIGESYRAIRPLMWRIVRIVVSTAIRFTGAVMVAVAAGFGPMFLITATRPYLNQGTSVLVTWGIGLLTLVAVGCAGFGPCACTAATNWQCRCAFWSAWAR
jgi:hypothetical protein